MRFLGLGLADRVPDANTIWLFREQLTQAGAIEALFDRFDAARCARRLSRHGRADRRCHACRRAEAAQHRGREEGRSRTGASRRTGRTKPAKLRQKDRDARWTLKFSKAKARPRRDGSRHGRHRHPDLRLQEPCLDRPEASASSADGTSPTPPPTTGACCARGCSTRQHRRATSGPTRAYRSRANEAFLERNGFVSRIHRRKPQGRPMPETIRRANAAKSNVRARVEHVFAQQKDQMGLFIRTIGITRAKAQDRHRQPRLQLPQAGLPRSHRRRLRGRSGSRQGSALPAPYAAAKKPGPRRKHPHSNRLPAK